MADKSYDYTKVPESNPVMYSDFITLMGLDVTRLRLKLQQQKNVVKHNRMRFKNIATECDHKSKNPPIFARLSRLAISKSIISS